LQREMVYMLLIYLHVIDLLASFIARSG